MEVYVGLDVSLKETSICVVDGSGKIVSEGKVLSEPLALAEFLAEPLTRRAVLTDISQMKRPKLHPVVILLPFEPSGYRVAGLIDERAVDWGGAVRREGPDLKECGKRGRSYGNGGLGYDSPEIIGMRRGG